MTRPVITIDPAIASGRKLRRAGARWRLLVHRIRPGRLAVSDHAYHVQSHPDRRPNRSQWSSTQVLAGTEFDELVVGRWLHVEQMDTGVWWMNVGGVTLHVTADRDGRPRRVMVHGPGDYDDPVPGCAYEHVWTAPDYDTIPDPPRQEQR